MANEWVDSANISQDHGLVRLVDLPEKLPRVAALLHDGRWTRQAEQALLAGVDGSGANDGAR